MKAVHTFAMRFRYCAEEWNDALEVKILSPIRVLEGFQEAGCKGRLFFGSPIDNCCFT